MRKIILALALMAPAVAHAQPAQPKQSATDRAILQLGQENARLRIMEGQDEDAIAQLQEQIANQAKTAAEMTTKLAAETKRADAAEAALKAAQKPAAKP